MDNGKEKYVKSLVKCFICVFLRNEIKKDMRQIKFKAQRVDGKGWVYGCYVNSGHLTREGSKVHYILQDEGMCFDDVIEVTPETVCQYTGLKDKNGNDIYEGDTLKGGIFNRYVVTWDYQDSSFSLNEYNCRKEFEVTGNIHDKK